MPPDLLALLDTLPVADLHRLRLDVIPRLLRERDADDAQEAYQLYLAEYERQVRGGK